MLKGLVGRISIVFGIVGTVGVVAIVVGALALTNMMGHVRELLARDLVEAIALTRSQNHLLRMNSNLAGSVLADSHDYDDARLLVTRSLQDYLDRLEEIRAASAEGARESGALKASFGEVQDSASRTLALMRAGDQAGSRAAVATELTPAVERQVERGRQLINRKWSRLEQDRVTTLDLATLRWWQIIALGVISPLPGLAALVWLAGSGLRTPMTQITDAAHRLRRGELAAPVAGNERTDEVGAIAVSLDLMRLEAIRAQSLEAETRSLAAAAEAARLRDLTDAAFEGLAVVADEVVSEANTSLARLLGVERDQLLGRPLSEILRLKDGQSISEVLATASAAPRRADVMLEGRSLPVELRTRAMSGAGDHGQKPRMVLAVRDLQERLAAEAKIRELAHHDPLTGLANRALLGERLDEAIAAADRSGPGFAVLCVDLDRFKPINDLHGHQAGDRVLREVARRLGGETGAGDTVARLGGDEFVVLRSGVRTAEEVTRLAERVLALLREGFAIGAAEPAYLAASIGIAMYPGDGVGAEALLANADSALYRVKRSTRDGFTFFQAARDADQHRRYLLEQDLRRALPNGELSLAYQPQTNCLSGAVEGFEALLRWGHPVRGAVSPGDFIPVAEDSELIVEIGTWVMRQACQEAQSWRVPLRIAVNVSPRQLERDDFVALVGIVLEETGLDPARLELEITEGLLIRETDRALRVIGELKALGVCVALDDFGSGFSSLGMLARFPFDRVKLDRAFVQSATERPAGRAIITAVVALGHALDMVVLAEGAETPEHLALLRAEACDEVQGYLTGKPLPIAFYAAVVHGEPAGVAGPPAGLRGVAERAA